MALALLTGCVGPRVAPPPLFYPPPPAAPQAVFLGGINEVPVDRAKADGADGSPGAAIWEQLAGLGPFPSVPLTRPAGLAVDGDALLICDPRVSRVFRLDYRTRRVSEWTGSDTTPLVSPVALSVGSDRTIYVADTAARYVLPFGPNGRPGRPISTNEATFRPAALTCAGDGLYVADARARRIWRFAWRGDARRGASDAPIEARRKVAATGAAVADLPFVTALATAPNGDLLACGGIDGAIRIIDPNGAVRSTEYGSTAAPAPCRPKSLAFDDLGRLFVVDAALQRVLVRGLPVQAAFDFGSSQRGRDALVLPHGIALSAAHVRYYRSAIPAGFEARQIAFVSNRAGPLGVSVFAVGRSGENGPARTDARRPG